MWAAFHKCCRYIFQSYRRLTCRCMMRVKHVHVIGGHIDLVLRWNGAQVFAVLFSAVMSRLSVDVVWVSPSFPPCVSLCLHPLHRSLSLFCLSLPDSWFLHVKLESLLRGVSFESRTPLYAPAPTPPVGDSLPAVSMVTSLLIVCSELWLFNFGVVEDENEWGSLGGKTSRLRFLWCGSC